MRRIALDQPPTGTRLSRSLRDRPCASSRPNLREGQGRYDSGRAWHRAGVAVFRATVSILVGELPLDGLGDGVLPWGWIDNRPWLRCLNGYGCACGGSAISRRQNTCLIAFSGSTPQTIKVCASILKRVRSERNGHLNDVTGQPQIEQRASRRNWSVHRPRSADCLLLKRGGCVAATSRVSPGASSTIT